MPKEEKKIMVTCKIYNKSYIRLVSITFVGCDVIILFLNMSIYNILSEQCTVACTHIPVKGMLVALKEHSTINK